MTARERYWEIEDGSSPILTPLTPAKQALLGDICGLAPGQRVLDLGSGRGEFLCQLALTHGVSGVGIDEMPAFFDDAVARAVELGVHDSVEFILGDAAAYASATDATFDVVSCLGATWMCGSLPELLELMRSRCTGTGWILLGEPYWIEPPPPAAGGDGDGASFDLLGLLDTFREARLDLTEMVLASADDYDRYAAGTWLNVARWLDEHPDDPDAPGIRALREQRRLDYLSYQRRCLGWGVFILRVS